MARLDIERQQRLEPKRIETAVRALQELGYEITHRDSTKIKFVHEGADVIYFPYSGWATGKTIKDGRGLKNLINQLKKQKKG